MAYTSIWSVRGWLGDVLLYTQDPEKTTQAAYFSGDYEKQELEDVIAYACQNHKTVQAENANTTERKFVSGVNLVPQIARQQMMQTKRQFGKDKGVAAYHGIQSFEPGEVTAELAHEIGVALAKRLWGAKYEVLVTTHLDREHIHNHFVVNTVSFVDGIRYYRSNEDYREMQEQSDKLCRAYGLSVIDHTPKGKGKHYAEWKAEKEGKPTYRGMIRKDIDTAVAEAVSERQLWDILRKNGYTIVFGKDITVRPKGKERGLKLQRNFGAEYSLDRLRKRILETSSPKKIQRTIYTSTKKVQTKSCLTHGRKHTGLRAVYFVYLYKMGVLPKKREPNTQRVYFLYREDIRFLARISAEAQLLAKHKIDTLEELFLHKETLKADPTKKKELKLCADIEERSKNMLEKMKIEKEGKNNDKQWGHSRTTDTGQSKRNRNRA